MTEATRDLRRGGGNGVGGVSVSRVEGAEMERLRKGGDVPWTDDGRGFQIVYFTRQ